jgi:signal transduction histidine kinase
MSESRAQARVVRFFEQLPLGAAILVALIAVATLVQWYLGIDPVMGFFPGGLAMLPLSCVSFLIAAVALGIESHPLRRPVFRGVALALALLVVLIGVIEAASWITGRDLGLDLILFPDKLLRAPWTPPGRISVNSVAGLITAGVALLFIQLDDKSDRSTAQWIALIPGTIAFLALIGYAFGVTHLYATYIANGMSLGAAVSLFLLSLGIIFARRRSGLPRLLADPGAAGAVARRLVPAAVVVPVALGWVRVFGERFGWYDASFRVAVYVVATVVIFLWLIGWAARMARESDRVREELLAREQAAREAAEAANISKSNFLAVMSHELRTPLSAIIGYEELLADGITGPVNEAQKHQLSRMKASAQHLLHLIDQILAFSRVDAGREVVHLEDTEANALASDAASLVEPLAREKGLPLEVVPTGYTLPMLTDAGKVRQVLVNLLSNAVKFTPAGRVTLIVQHDGGTVRYVVRDTGIGVAPEHSDRIFDPFWQVEQPSTRRVGGTGLGLSVTRRLARLLGGDVSVDSRLGEGSAFTVTLPLESDGRKKHALEPAPAD